MQGRGKKQAFSQYLSSLSDQEFSKWMSPLIDAVKADVRQAAVSGAENFYNSYAPETYDRTESFCNLGQKDPEIRRTSDGLGIEMVFRFGADEVTVNPWGGCSGDPQQAFDADYVNGYHGGPRRVASGYSWDPVPKTESPFDYIVKTLQSKYGEVIVDG